MNSGGTGKPVEVSVISGKGGTGKTSLTAAMAVLAGDVVVADCDVDAADLHLVLQPRVRERHDFTSGHEAVIRAPECTACGLCAQYCRYDAIRRALDMKGGEKYRVDSAACEGCGVCVRFCPAKAIDFPESHCGDWFVSNARTGPMVHARLAPGAENSGKLVSRVREAAREEAGRADAGLILVDGPPGIGCPVIAAVTGARLVLVVVEPTLSGQHDLERALDLARHFGIPAALCINKWDINPDLADQIEAASRERGVPTLGRVPFDPAVTRAQVRGHTVVDEGGAAAEAIRILWDNLQEYLDKI